VSFVSFVKFVFNVFPPDGLRPFQTWATVQNRLVAHGVFGVNVVSVFISVVSVSIRANALQARNDDQYFAK
jgi:hypothetical protein